MFKLLKTFVIPNKKLARFFHVYVNLYYQKKDLSMNNEVINRITSDITRYIFERNDLEALGPIDVKYFLLQYICRYIHQYPHLETLNIDINDSGYANANLKSIKLNIDKSLIFDPKKFTKKMLASVHIDAVNQGLNALVDMYSKNKFHFSLEVEITNDIYIKEIASRFPIKMKYLTISLDCEVKQSILLFEGTYLGSHSKFLRRLNDDIYSILAILEFNESIRVKESLHRNKMKAPVLFIGETGNLNLKLNLPDSNMLETTNLQQRWNEILNDFVSNNLFIVDTRVLKILDETPGISINRFVIEFFNTEQSRFSGYDFLRYWQAVEVILGSPNNGKIEETLKSGIEEYLSGSRRMEDYQALRNLRHDIVHKGLKNVDPQQLFLMRDLAKSLFIRKLFHKSKTSLVSDMQSRKHFF